MHVNSCCVVGLIQMNTQEENYQSFGAEAFYVAKVSFQPISN